MFARRIALMVGLVGLGAAQSGSAQRVSADIHIGSGPVGATISTTRRRPSRVSSQCTTRSIDEATVGTTNARRGNGDLASGARTQT